jgi:hypothetical protein
LKALWKLGFVALLVASGGFFWFKWKQDEPRRDCVKTLEHLCQALDSHDSASLLKAIALPQAIQNRPAAEQAEFLTKALRDEISPEGLVALKTRGNFGSLKQLFPAEGDAWARQAGDTPEACVAFKMERSGVRAEVVLLREKGLFRVIRCNNVKQMAAGRNQS